ncbi:hypothetical protein BST29_09725 [Mycobacterium malmoense]|uniref:Uncharacterized protein n=1 Tax=Mycobacterium malmoense TaxID=1780 RepID=A0ABX3SUY2_MYCMA|nr:hypothetical protein BMG05_03765 [Mycobacterium malmoense]ORA83789.1 hypothetical protein BST29_09725 [Mycobacterium malmoense]
MADPFKIDFALEAKCYAEMNSGWRATGQQAGFAPAAPQFRGLRHAFVFHPQVYDEVRADGRPIALVCGRDVADTLRATDMGTWWR